MNKLEIIGDSITRGVIFSAQRNRYYLCEDNKYKNLCTNGLCINSRSKMGATVMHWRDIMPSVLSDLDENSTVLFEFGGNDCDYNWQEISDDPNGDYLPHTPEKEYLCEYEKAICAVKSRGARVAVSSLVPIDENRYMAHITRGRSYGNILQWLGGVETLSSWQAHYNELTVALAKKLSCPLFDIRDVFLKQADYRTLLSDDGIHPNEDGHRLIHSALYGFAKTMA